MKIIGMCGLKGSGKDTAANILVQHFKYTKLSFAHVLKNITSELFGWKRELLEGDTDESRIFRELPDSFWEYKLDWANNHMSKKFLRFTPRVALQYIGTDVLRNNFHKNIWLDRLELEISRYEKVVISDARFSNEIDFVKNNKGKVIWIKRQLPQWVDLARKVKTNPENISILNTLVEHESEWQWLTEDFDYEIDNTKTILDLHEEIRKIIL